jgi:hypothetical protein
MCQILNCAATLQFCVFAVLNNEEIALTLNDGVNLRQGGTKFLAAVQVEDDGADFQRSQ